VVHRRLVALLTQRARGHEPSSGGGGTGPQQQRAPEGVRQPTCSWLRSHAAVLTDGARTGCWAIL